MADKQQHYLNLSKLLAAGFFICGIIPILIIATTSIYNSKQVAIKDLEVTASQVAQHRQDVINNFLDHQVDLLTTLMNLYPLDYLKDQKNLDQLFLAVSKSGNMVDLQLIDTNGQQLAYVGPYREQVTGKNYQDQPWFSEVLVRGAHVSDVFSGYRKIPHFVVALTDPLKRYDSRSSLLRKGRALAQSLAAMQRRLEQPALTADALTARLTGPLGPTFVSLKTVGDVEAGHKELADGIFTLAEIALTVGRVDWVGALRFVDRADGMSAVQDALDEIESLQARLGDNPADLAQYAARAMKEARRCLSS